MATATSIEWTDVVWNPVRGCSIVSKGCTNCYAMKQAHRFSGPGGTYKGLTKRTNGGPVWTGDVRLVPELLDAPLKWRKPRRVFVNSMSDLFHEAVPDNFIDQVFAVMALCPQHTFQVLTKRPGRMRNYLCDLMSGRRLVEEHAGWRFSQPNYSEKNAEACLAAFGATEPTCMPTHPLANVWLGVSVEDQPTADERIPLLLQTPAAVRFASYEPALASVDFRPWLFRADTLVHDEPTDGDIVEQRAALAWVIVGGESGPGARAFDVQWARDTIAACKAAGVGCFVKQLGARPQEIAYPADVNEAEARQWMHDGWTRITEPRSAGDDIVHWRRYWHLRNRKGADMSEWPADLRLRELPGVTP